MALPPPPPTVASMRATTVLLAVATVLILSLAFTSASIRGLTAARATTLAAQTTSNAHRLDIVEEGLKEVARLLGSTSRPIPPAPDASPPPAAAASASIGAVPDFTGNFLLAAYEPIEMAAAKAAQVAARPRYTLGSHAYSAGGALRLHSAAKGWQCHKIQRLQWAIRRAIRLPIACAARAHAAARGLAGFTTQNASGQLSRPQYHPGGRPTLHTCACCCLTA